MENLKVEKKIILKSIVFSVIGVLIVLILWSVTTETLLPLYRSRQYNELIYNMLGIPVLLLGVGIFAYGGWLFARDTGRLMNNNLQLAENVDKIKNKSLPKKEIKEARSENTKLLFSTWRKGAFWLLIGAIVIIAGGLIINIKKITG